jgi:hypothetical protein
VGRERRKYGVRSTEYGETALPPGRLKDLADVQELIRLLSLPSDFAERLPPYVRAKYGELWQAVQDATEQ